MRPVVLTLHVDAAAAVREGRSAAGPARLELSDADVATLSERQRETLARHLERAPGYGEPLTTGAPPIGHADLAALASLLDTRADAMAIAESIGLLPRCMRSGLPTDADGRCSQCRFIGRSDKQVGPMHAPVCEVGL
jgi:hypothetical protein